MADEQTKVTELDDLEVDELVDSPKPKPFIKLVVLIAVVGFFFAGYNLSIYFDTVLMKQYLCSSAVYACDKSSAANTQATSTFNLIRTIQQLVFLTSLIVGGAISDDLRTKFGNRAPMILGGAILAATGYALAPFLLMIGTDLAVFSGSLAYLFIGVGIGFALAPDYSLVSELFTREERGWAGLGFVAMGAMGTGIGIVLEEVLVSPFAQDDIPWVLVFFTMAVLLIILGFLSFLFIPHANPPFPPMDGVVKDILNTPKYMFTMGASNESNRDFLLLFLVTMLWGAGGFVLTTNLPNFMGELNKLGYAEITQGSILVLTGVVGGIFVVPVGWILTKVGKVKGAMIGTIIYGLFTFFLAQTAFWSDLAILSLVLFYGVGAVFIASVKVSLPADLVPKGKEGQFMGLILVAGGLLSPVAGFAVVVILNFTPNDVLAGYSNVFLMTTLMQIIAIGLLSFMHYEDQIESEYRRYYRRYLIFKGYLVDKTKVSLSRFTSSNKRRR